MRGLLWESVLFEENLIKTKGRRGVGASKKNIEGKSNSGMVSEATEQSVAFQDVMRLLVCSCRRVGFVSLVDSSLVRERKCCLVESVVSLVDGRRAKTVQCCWSVRLSGSGGTVTVRVSDTVRVSVGVGVVWAARLSGSERCWSE